jgi:hypothetical protein
VQVKSPFFNIFTWLFRLQTYVNMLKNIFKKNASEPDKRPARAYRASQPGYASQSQAEPASIASPFPVEYTTSPPSAEQQRPPMQSYTAIEHNMSVGTQLEHASGAMSVVPVDYNASGPSPHPREHKGSSYGQQTGHPLAQYEWGRVHCFDANFFRIPSANLYPPLNVTPITGLHGEQ